MKRIGVVLFIITSIIFSTSAQSLNFSENSRTCDFGLTFEISTNPNWGYGEPVVTAVEPYSYAEKAGIKVGDIIMEINRTATYLRNYQTIKNWLQDPNLSEMILTIRNVNTYFKEFVINRECKNVNSINEFALASAYSFYSLENTSSRAFSLPLRVDPNLNVDFSDYHTFDFIDEGGNVPEIDYRINAEIEKALLSRGLVRDTKDPDFIVQSYYSFEPNLRFSSASRGSDSRIWRYDSDSRMMVQLPFLSADDPNAETKGQYILELGIRFFDKKYIDNQKLTQIWDCRSREFLKQEFDLAEYARLHAPLMAMQFPYSAPKTTAKYVVDFKAFNYTGMQFNVNDMQTISNVDPNSPAWQAGIREGDVIEKINGIKFGYSLDELEGGYRRFIIESMPLRDKRTRFIDANGFPDCMLWDRNKYPEIAEMFHKEAFYTTSFSYLYAFERYVSGASTPSLFIEYSTRDGQKKTANLMPQVQKSVVVKAL